MGGQVLVRRGHKNAAISVGATAASYTTGKVIGVPTKIPFSMLDTGGSALLKSLCVIDKEAVGLAMDIYFFQQKPTSQGADTGTFALTAAESVYLLGRVTLAAGDFTASSVIKEATKTNIDLQLAAMTGAQAGVIGQGSKDVWMLVVARASITYSSAASLWIRAGIEQN